MGSISPPHISKPPHHSITFTTPLGTIKATYTPLPTRNSTTKILHCLGIPYASIPYRWAAPHAPPTARWASPRDCTSFGPGCPQSHHPLFDVDGIPIFGRPGPGNIPIRTETEDEFRCLNLNIYAPIDIVSGDEKGEHFVMKEKVPVLVWVYGGAYQVGSGGVGVYDGTNVVARSVELGSPIIVVTFNYRVGVLGHIHSGELAADAAKQVDVPPHFRSTANLSLLDSYMAFHWVKNNIHHFGGDPQNITAMGESAGASIIHHLSIIPDLHLQIPRIVLSSSTCFSTQLLRATEAQTWYSRICENFSIQPSSPDVVSRLREVNVEELVSGSYFAYPAFRPTWDDVTITFDPREVLSRPQLWDQTLEGMIFGVCRNEPWLRRACNLDKPPDLKKTVSSRIPPVKGLREQAIRLYNDDNALSSSSWRKFPWFATKPLSTSNLALVSEIAMEAHARYYAPAVHVSESFLNSRRRSLYRYLFSYRSSLFPREWPVTHTSDILPLFLHPALPAEEQDVAKSMVDQLLYFVSGKSGQKVGWKKYTLEGRAVNELDSEGKWRVVNESAGNGEKFADLGKEHLALWASVADAVLETGRDGWVGMGR